jgi:hypothetical protein
MSSTHFKLKIHLQEKGCIYRYGMVFFTCISISGLEERRMCSILRSRKLVECWEY